MQPSTIGGINKLPEEEKRTIYARYIPRELTEKFNLPHLTENRELLQFRFAEGSVMWKCGSIIKLVSRIRFYTRTSPIR